MVDWSKAPPVRAEVYEDLLQWTAKIEKQRNAAEAELEQLKGLFSKLYYEQEYDNRSIGLTRGVSLVRTDDGRGAEPEAVRIWKLLNLGAKIDL